MFFNVRKKLPVLKGFRTCIDNKKSLLHLPGQSRSRGHPSVKFSLRPARPLSLFLDFSALYDFLRPAHKGASSPFSHHDFKHCAASISSTFVGAFSFSRRRRLQPGRRLSTKKFSSVQILPLLAGNIPNLSLDLRARQILHDICLKTRATFPFAAAKLQVRKAFFPYSCQQQKERFPYAAGHLSWRRSLPGR